MDRGLQSETPENSSQADNVHSNTSLGQGSLLVSMYNAAKDGRARNAPKGDGHLSLTEPTTPQENLNASSALSFENERSNVWQSRSDTLLQMKATPRASGHLGDFTEWSRSYLFSTKHKVAPDVPTST